MPWSEFKTSQRVPQFNKYQADLQYTEADTANKVMPRELPAVSDGNHIITCKLLNKIANHCERYESAELQNLRTVLDNATESIWKKKDLYYKTHSNNKV